jgi:S-adenosylmethionine/arginine decarboxylase-like enzyme
LVYYWSVPHPLSFNSKKPNFTIFTALGEFVETKAQHLMVDIWLDTEYQDQLLDIIKKEVDENLTVVKKIEHKFEPQGETLVWILSESHFAVHTYPEHQYISFDIYICSLDIDLHSLLERIEAQLPIKFIDKKFSFRGHKYLSTTVSNLDHAKDSLKILKLPSEARRSSLILLFFATVVAMCSLLYELLLAQTLSTTMGNTVLRYNVTIGLYIASMGVGALVYKKLLQWWKNSSQNEDTGFVTVEILLSCFGVLAPIMVLIVDSLFQKSGHYQSLFSQTSLFVFNHSLIVLIGFLSGLELPLLMDMGKKIHQQLGRRVLAFDYLGTLVAAIIFPIVLVPFFNLYTIAAMVAILNAIVAFSFVLYRRLRSLYLIIPLVISILGNILFLIFEETCNRWIIERFYLLGSFI